MLGGRYSAVQISAVAPIVARGIRVEDAKATLRDVRVSAGAAWRGTVRDVPIDSGRGEAVVPYTSVNAAVRRYGGAAGSAVSVAGNGPGRARLQGPLGLSVAITARVTAGKLLISPSESDLGALPAPAADPIRESLAAPVPLPPFPFNVELASGRFEPDGLHLGATSRGSVFPVR